MDRHRLEGSTWQGCTHAFSQKRLYFYTIIFVVKWFKNKIQVSQVLLDPLPLFSGSAAFSQQPHNQKKSKMHPEPSHPPATTTPISHCKSVTKQRPSPPTAACPTRASVS